MKLSQIARIVGVGITAVGTGCGGVSTAADDNRRTIVERSEASTEAETERDVTDTGIKASTDAGIETVSDAASDVDAYTACGFTTSRISCVACCSVLFPASQIMAYEEALSACVCRDGALLCPACAESCAGFPAEGDAGACAACTDAAQVYGGACVYLVRTICDSDCSQLSNCFNEQCGGWPYPADGGKYEP